MKPVTMPPREGGPGAAATAASQPRAAGLEDRKFFEGLIRGMRCGILAADRRGTLRVVNAWAREILGPSAELEVGRPVHAALQAFPDLVRIFEEAYGLTQLPNRAELEVRCPGGDRKMLGFTVSMIPGSPVETDPPAGVAIFFKDLTHVEHREEQIRLRDRLAALGEMAANLAHEIRNPLASIEVTCALIRRRIGEDSGARELLDKVVAEVRRLNGTITSSLDYVRPVSLSLAPASLQEILQAALRSAMGRRGGPEVQVVVEATAELPPFLMDGERVRQVFENLFLNALEAMAGPGTLSIRVDTEAAPARPTVPYRPAAQDGDPERAPFDRYARVQVRDTGPGIEREHLEKLFHPFFTTKRQGSGIGLAMARKIVDGHRGTLDVRNHPEGGAQFTVRLPMLSPDVEESTA